MQTSLESAIGQSQDRSVLVRLVGTQVFWVLMVAMLACLLLAMTTDSFTTQRNLFNVMRNFAFVGIIAIGMTAVIASGGIDLSVGSTVVLSAMIVSVLMEGGASFWMAALAALGGALVVGMLNGILIAYAGIPAFVATLGMLSAVRSLAMVLSDNRMIYQFGPDHDLLLWVGGGQTLGVPHPLFFMVALALVMTLVFTWARWGQHVYAVGGNEQAANLTGISVRRLKVSVYMFSAFTAGLAGILMIGWLGSATTNLGTSLELTVIAAAVIGGANLAGGEGTPLGAVIGALLIEVIRNSLILLGISTFWQGMFIGASILIAAGFDRIRHMRP